MSTSDFSRYLAAVTHKYAANKPGLWANIRAKRERGGKPAQPGDKDYPEAKSWKKVTAISAKKQANQAAPLTETTAAGKKYNWDEMNAQSKQQALRTEGAVRKYLQAWAAKHTKDPEYIYDSWEDLEDNLPLRWGPGGFDPHYMVDDLHMDIGNKLRDPAQFDAGLKSLLPKLHLEKQSGSPAWQREEGKNEEGGLNAKGRASYNKATGGNLKAPVTEKNPKGKRAKRQNSFCARMCGMKRVNTGSKTKSDPDSRINKSLRKWNCKCGSDKQANAYVSDPLIPALLGVAGGSVVGGLNAPKGELLKYMLGGAGIGGSAGLLAGTGRSLGALGANALVANQGLTGNSAAAAELGLPIAGILGGGLLSLPIARRIEEELTYKPQKEEKEKQAAMPGLMGAFAGSVGGALTGKKNKRTRAIGRGAAIGAATELGMYPGAVLGAIPGALLGSYLGVGMLPGAALGGVAGAIPGGMLGNAAAQGLLGPYETEEELAQEKEQEEKKMAASAFEFGRKLAAVTTCAAPEHNDQSGVDVNPVAAGTPEGKEKLTKKKLPLKAEDVISSKAAEFGRKLAQSLVNFVERKPKDLTKGTLNPRAAGEKEEEVHEEPAEEDDGLIV